MIQRTLHNGPPNPAVEFALEQAIPTGEDAEWDGVPYAAGDEDVLNHGRELYAHAVQMEDEQGAVTPEVAKEYRRAALSLVGGAAAAPDDVTRLIMISNSFSKQTEAEEVAPYQGEEYQSGWRQHLDRRQVLQSRSSDYLDRAGELLLNKDAAAKKILESAVAKAALRVSERDSEGQAANAATVQHDTAELLDTEGVDGVRRKLVGEQHAEPSTFNWITGEVVLEELGDAPVAVAA